MLEYINIFSEFPNVLEFLKYLQQKEYQQIINNKAIKHCNIQTLLVFEMGANKVEYGNLMLLSTQRTLEFMVSGRGANKVEYGKFMLFSGNGAVVMI